ncbi:MAG: hypothetical protein LPJ87_05715 [Zoogloeaceae bacterium]|nr:hypothetical protein [Zoogloeaceae bacterium]
MISNTSGAASVAFSELQRQQAERNADLAEQRARSLQAETRQARAEADQAQERARKLEVETDQASEAAGRARSGLAASRSLQQLDAQLGQLREQIASSKPAEVPPTEAPRPAVNAQGEITGTVINVSA